MWSFDRDVLNSSNSFSFILLESEPSVEEKCGDTAGGDTELHPDTDTEMVAEKIISGIVTGTVGLQKDQDKIVWTVATEQLGIYHCLHEDIGSVHQRIFLIVDR